MSGDQVRYNAGFPLVFRKVADFAKGSFLQSPSALSDTDRQQYVPYEKADRPALSAPRVQACAESFLFRCVSDLSPWVGASR